MKRRIHEAEPYEEKEPAIERRHLEELFPDELDDFIADCFAKKQELDAQIELAIKVRETME